MNEKEEEIAEAMTEVAWEDIVSQGDQLQNVALITYASKELVTNIWWTKFND